MDAAIYPGTFDPITMGHLDLIVRASRLFRRLVVGVAENPTKKPLFSLDKRIYFVKKSVNGLQNVEVRSFGGLLVEFARELGINVIIKGMRVLTDFEYEFQMAQINQGLNPDIETVFLVSNSKYSFLSSSAVKEVAFYGGNLSDLVPESVREEIEACFAERKFC